MQLPTDRRRIAILTTPILIAVGLPIWQTQFRYGWTEMALGQFAWLFWAMAFAWVALTFIAIRRYRAWWLLLSAPFVFYPIASAIMLLVACVSDNCL